MDTGTRVDTVFHLGQGLGMQVGPVSEPPGQISAIQARVGGGGQAGTGGGAQVVAKAQNRGAGYGVLLQ